MRVTGPSGSSFAEGASPRSNRLIELRGVTKRFRGRLAVDDLTLEVPAGRSTGCWDTTERGKARPSA